jgi:hypothetical protein
MPDRTLDAKGEVTLLVQYAWKPRPSSHAANGRDHLVTTAPLSFGRFKREAGDALCKPRRKFWQLEKNYATEADCKKCLAIKERYKL